jgi:hypothetical protein
LVQVPIFFLPKENALDDDWDRKSNDQAAGNRPGQENQGTSLGHEKGLTKSSFRDRAEDKGQDQGSGLELQPAQEVTGDSEKNHHPDVENVTPGAINSYDA